MNQKEIIIQLTECDRSQLDTPDRELLLVAEEMTRQAYAPYSNFCVGAAIRLDNGQVVKGNNQENVAFPSGTCAERSAAFYAGANFPKAKFETIAVAARESGGDFPEEPISPCGACRQALLEFEKRAGRPVRVILGGKDKVYILPSIASLLPLAFTEF